MALETLEAFPFSEWHFNFPLSLCLVNFEGCTEFSKNQHLLGFGLIATLHQFLSRSLGKVCSFNKRLVRNPSRNWLLGTANLGGVTRKIVDHQLPLTEKRSEPSCNASTTYSGKFSGEALQIRSDSGSRCSNKKPFGSCKSK